MKTIPSIEYILFLIVLILIEFIAINLLKKIRVTDIPSERSSHTIPTPRGGGIIFPIAFIYWFFVSNQQDWLLIVGVILLAAISLWDDFKSLSPSVRFIVHFIATLFLIYVTVLFQWEIWYSIITLIVLLAFLNAFNFMDGINGITGLYSLITISTLFYINYNNVAFIESELLVLLGLSVIVFLLFNFRHKALIFSGDVGSLSMAYIFGFLILRLIVLTGDIKYVFLFLIYGMDTFFTIVQRFVQKENITKPHRKHLYQVLVNEYGLSHLLVSGMYAMLQLSINIWLLTNALSSYTLLYSILFCSLIFISVKIILLHRLKNTVSNN